MSKPHNDSSPKLKLGPEADELGRAKKMKKMTMTLAACLIVAGVAAFLVINNAGKTNPTPGAKKAAASTPKTISFEKAKFDDGKARHFTYKAPGGIIVRFFVLKSSDGVIRAAFDACDVCWRSGKGYEQRGDYMICRNCGRRFASVKVNEEKGGCNPAPLNRRIKGGRVVINIADVLTGKRYFDHGAGSGS